MADAEVQAEGPRELVEEFLRGEVISDLPPDVRERLEKHIDNWIRLWRLREPEHAAAPHYIEAYQTVREAVLGERLP